MTAMTTATMQCRLRRIKESILNLDVLVIERRRLLAEPGHSSSAMLFLRLRLILRILSDLPIVLLSATFST